MAKKDKKWSQAKVMADELIHPSEELEMTPEAELMDFDIWHIMRSGRIPAIHMKEVIKADFKGRGLSNKETMECFDQALSDYGIKL